MELWIVTVQPYAYDDFQRYRSVKASKLINLRRNNMWTKPAATEMRFGFEVTMYVCNR